MSASMAKYNKIAATVPAMPLNRRVAPYTSPEAMSDQSSYIARKSTPTKSVERKFVLNLPQIPLKERDPMRICFSMNPKRSGIQIPSETKQATDKIQPSELTKETKEKTCAKVGFSADRSPCASARMFSMSSDAA